MCLAIGSNLLQRHIPNSTHDVADNGIKTPTLLPYYVFEKSDVFSSKADSLSKCSGRASYAGRDVQFSEMEVTPMHSAVLSEDMPYGFLP